MFTYFSDKFRGLTANTKVVSSIIKAELSIIAKDHAGMGAAAGEFVYFAERRPYLVEPLLVLADHLAKNKAEPETLVVKAYEEAGFVSMPDSVLLRRAMEGMLESSKRLSRYAHEYAKNERAQKMINMSKIQEKIVKRRHQDAHQPLRMESISPKTYPERLARRFVEQYTIA